MINHISFIVVGFAVAFLAFIFGRVVKFFYNAMSSDSEDKIKWED